MKSSNKKNQRGITLIEVLIALVIIAIALTAVIKATSENIRQTAYLRQKTVALWVGKTVLNQARVGLIKLPTDSDSLKDSTDLLGTTWYWEADQVETPNPRIKKIQVRVFARPDDDETRSPLIRLESFIYRAES